MQIFWRLGAPPPDPHNSPPIANFWLRAWAQHHTNINSTVKTILINFKRYVVKFFKVNVNIVLKEIVRASDGYPITDALILIIIIQITVFLRWFFRPDFSIISMAQIVWRSSCNLEILI